MTRYERVVQILDTAIGGPNVNIGAHGAFWRNTTRDQFVALIVKGRQLLIVANGADSNLVKALKGEAPFGADLDNPPPGAVLDRMPDGMPPVPDPDIAFIKTWIDQGCLEDPFVAARAHAVAPVLRWRKTNAPVASSRTDDIWFLDVNVGWAVNSNGQIVKTTDGGNNWVEQFHDEDVYFRCIGFATPTRGWAGTLSVPRRLFETSDGGTTWTPVAGLPPLAPSAVCGLSVVSPLVVYASGTNFPNRPPRMMKTTDGGATWMAWDMRPWASILIDCYFPTPDRGWVVGGKTDEPTATRLNVKPVVLFTADGGRTWQNQVANLQAQFPLGEWGWKIQFLDDKVGFVSLENFTAGAILKTTDGGQTWTRLPVNDPQGNANLEGIGFIDEQNGWVGGWGDAQFQRLSSSATADGGRTWTDADDIGKALNRFRFFGKPVTVGYASGQTVYKYSAEPSAAAGFAMAPRKGLLDNTQPIRVAGAVQMAVNVPAGAGHLTLRVWDRFGDELATPVNESIPASGPRVLEWDRRRSDGTSADPGYCIARVTVDNVSESQLIHLAAPQRLGGMAPPRSAAVSNVATTHVVLAGSERRLTSGSKVIGAADPHQVAQLTLKLRRKNPLPDPIHQRVKIDRSEFASLYGAATEDIAKVKQVLAQCGLNVVGENPVTRSVEVSGPVSAVEKAFQVKLLRCVYDDENYRGRTGSIHLPSALDGIVTGVFGLDTRRVARRRRNPNGMRLAATSLASAAHRGFLPAELGQFYDFPDGTGAGQTIGILEFGGGLIPDDLKQFCQIANVPQPKVDLISIDHTPTGLDNQDAIEVMLDIEVIVGLCPQATIPVYFGQFTEQGWIRTLDAAIHDPQHDLSVLSISWGAPEEAADLWTGGGVGAVNDVLHEAATMQITVLVASGDDGSDDQVGDGQAHADFPSSSPFVVGVGGTDLRASGGRVTSERVWKDGDGLRADRGGSSGGGVSSKFQRPSFQDGIDIISANPGALLGRIVPDVAAHAQTDGQSTGYFFVFDGNAVVNGGTSASAPLWAALIARINAALGKRVGYLTPLLYQAVAGGTVGSLGCKDITEGDNISTPTGLGYKAGPGYDAVTGWGSPRGKRLMALLEPLI